MTAPDPARLAEITATAADCQTYNFGLTAANRLAHNDVPYLLGLVGRLSAAVAAVHSECDYLETLADGDKHYAALIRKALEAGNE